MCFVSFVAAQCADELGHHFVTHPMVELQCTISLGTRHCVSKSDKMASAVGFCDGLVCEA